VQVEKFCGNHIPYVLLNGFPLPSSFEVITNNNNIIQKLRSLHAYVFSDIIIKIIFDIMHDYQQKR